MERDTNFETKQGEKKLNKTVVVSSTLAIVCGAVLVNEAFGLIKIGGRTPLTLIRDTISKN